MITPIQEIDNFFFKRDDYYTICNSNGGKSRSAYYLVSKSTKEGITSAGSRSSPQLKILSNICQELKKTLCSSYYNWGIRRKFEMFI